MKSDVNSDVNSDVKSDVKFHVFQRYFGRSMNFNIQSEVKKVEFRIGNHFQHIETFFSTILVLSCMLITALTGWIS